MGNCPKCDNTISIEITYENNEVIILNEVKNERFPIIKNIEGNSQNRKFINLIDFIYQKIPNISDENISIIKSTIKYILQSIVDNKKSINNYLKEIDDFIKDIYDIEKLKSFINLFIFIYLNKDKIENNKKIYFIESINNVLKETKAMILENIQFFINYLENIFQINNVENAHEDQENIIENKREEQDIENIPKDQVNDNNILEEESKTKIEKKMTYNETETNFGKKEDDFNPNSLIICNDSRYLIREESKSSSSNFSKYSENSKHQVLKLEEEKKERDNLIKLLLSGNLKEIIFYDEKEKKGYPLKIPNEEIQFETIIKLFFINYPDLKEKVGKTYTYKNRKIKLEDKIEINGNDKIFFKIN